MSSDNNLRAAINLIIQASIEGKPRHEPLLTVCETPQYLIDHGFPQLPVSITGAVIDKVHFDHGITKGTLERLGEIICNPRSLYKSATKDGAAVVVTFEMKNGSPILVPLHPNKQVGRSTYVNLVASMYHKEPAIETRWEAQGLLLWKATK